LKGKNTIFKEILSDNKINDTLFLRVEGVNEKLTLFKFTKQTDSSFVYEQPKKQIYFLKCHALIIKLVHMLIYKIKDLSTFRRATIFAR